MSIKNLSFKRNIILLRKKERLKIFLLTPALLYIPSLVLYSHNMHRFTYFVNSENGNIIVYK